MVAPYLVSEKRSGFAFKSQSSFIGPGSKLYSSIVSVRARKNKLDAKQLFSYSISIRCQAPPSRRKVPIQFKAWITMADGARKENLFRKCQLLQDRPEVLNISAKFYHCTNTPGQLGWLEPDSLRCLV